MSAAQADLTQLIRDLNEAGDNLQPQVHQVLAETAAQVQAIAVSMAPRKTGALAASIMIIWHGDDEVEIAPMEKYGVYQEFGTGERGEFPGHAYEIKPKSVNGRLVFTVNGKTVYARKVTNPGVPPHPFMRPALVQALGPAAGQLADAGALQIVHG